MFINFKRLLAPPEKTFLLLGPRGTGKSYWLRTNFKPQVTINLLSSEEFFRYKANPGYLEKATQSLKKGDWVVIDEAQRVPEILNEVHRLYEERGIQFAITGSSARKLKRSNANLLAGRAIRCDFFPLVWQEINDAKLKEKIVDFGTLPLVLAQPHNATESLSAYVETYLKEEIAAEALTRNLEPFARFLLCAAQHHGQLLNVEAIAKESAVKRRSVDNYFAILEETLLGFRLPALNLKLRAKEASHPKFYFFDAGVARAAAGWLRELVPDTWRGFAFESLVLNEIRAYNSYQRKDKNVYHYSVTQSFDVDFIIETKKKIFHDPPSYLAIEVKYSKKWHPDWSKHIKHMLEDSKSHVHKAIGIYWGTENYKDGNVEILSFDTFCEKLWSGEFY